MIQHPCRMYKLLIATCLLGLAGFLFISFASVIYPHDLDVYEGTIFLPAIRIVAGKPIYGSAVVLNEPYLYAVYGPVYYGIVGFILQFSGLKFWPGRLISLLATIATALLIVRGVKSNKGESTPGFIAAVMFLMMPTTWSFGSLQRVDAVGVFFGILSIVAALSNSKCRFHWLISGSAAALAFFTKPSLVAAGISISICLLLKRRLKDFGIFLLGVSVALVVATILLVITNNDNYWFNLVSTTQVPYETRLAVILMRDFGQSHIVVASLIFTVIGLRNTRLSEFDFSILLSFVFLFVSGSISIMTCRKEGASLNYFYEVAAALALCSAWGLSQLCSDNGKAMRVATTVLVISILADLVLFRVAFLRGRLLIPQAKRPIHTRLTRDLSSLIPRNEPIAGEYTDAVIRTGHRLYFNDLAMYQMGPEQMRLRLQTSLESKELAALVTASPVVVPGYKLAKGYGYTDPNSVSGNYPGPLLYLREDVWRKQDR